MAQLITQNLRINFTDVLHSIMDTSTVKKNQIVTVMWCLQNLMLHKINPGANQREHLVNFMIRAALSIDDGDL